MADFVKLLQGFSDGVDIIDAFETGGARGRIASPLLKQLVTVNRSGGGGGGGGGCFPDLRAQLGDFCARFDADKAQATGRIEPRAGTDAQFDNAVQVL